MQFTSVLRVVSLYLVASNFVEAIVRRSPAHLNVRDASTLMSGGTNNEGEVGNGRITLILTNCCNL